MKRYRVAGGVARVGPGQVLALSDAQIKRRAHNLTIEEKLQGGAVVTAQAVLEFKVGEQIGLPDLPKNLAEILVPLDEPKTPAEQVAVVKERERQQVKAREKRAAKTAQKGKQKHR